MGAVLGKSELPSLNVLWVQGKKAVQFVSRSAAQQRSSHKISKRSIVSLDTFITLALYKLAHLLSGAKFCSCDRAHFQMQPRYMVCKNALCWAHFRAWKLRMHLKSGSRHQNPITWMHLIFHCCLSQLTFCINMPWVWVKFTCKSPWYQTSKLQSVQKLGC